MGVWRWQQQQVFTRPSALCSTGTMLLPAALEGFPVESVEIVEGRRCRFACVKFKTAEACSSALNNMQGVVLGGRALHLKQWNEQRSARSTR